MKEVGKETYPEKMFDQEILLIWRIYLEQLAI